MNLEDTFAKVMGRPTSDAERQRLHRIRDALGVQDNDALWAIVMTLELYDALNGRYAAAAASEAAKVRAMLAKQGARTGTELAKPGSSAEMRWRAAAGAGQVAFGAICLSAGAMLGGGARPFWAATGGGASWPRTVLGLVLGAPAGWMAFALLLPAVGHAGWGGVQLAREGRWVGWAMAAAAALGVLGCVVLLLEVL